MHGGEEFVPSCRTHSDDVSWREWGHWAIDTANPNSWTTAREWLPRTKADVVLVQETKTFKPHLLKAMHGQAGRAGRIITPTPAHRTAADKASGGCAVLVHKGTGLEDNTDKCVADGFQHRIALAHVNGIMRGGVHVGSVWLRHSEGLTPENMEILQTASAALTKI